MPIPFPETVVPEVPAVPAKIVAYGWVKQVFVRADDPPNPDNPRDHIEIEVCGFVPETGEIVPTLTKKVRVPLWKAVAARPEVAAAMESVLAAVPALQAYAAELAAEEAAARLEAQFGGGV